VSLLLAPLLFPDLCFPWEGGLRSWIPWQQAGTLVLSEQNLGIPTCQQSDVFEEARANIFPKYLLSVKVCCKAHSFLNIFEYCIFVVAEE